MKESGRNYLRVEVNRSECREICSQGSMETSNSRTTTARRQRMRWRDTVERDLMLYLRGCPGQSVEKDPVKVAWRRPIVGRQQQGDKG